MATIKERGKRFTAIVRRRGYPAQCKTFHRRADAINWSLDVEREMERGTFKVSVPSAATIPTVSVLLSLYSDKISPTKRSGRGEQSLIRTLRHDIVCRDLMARRPADVTGRDIATVRDRWDGSGAAAATIVRKLSLLSHAFEMARKEWSIECNNPVRGTRWPRVSNERARRVSEDELCRILSATQSDELPGLLLLLAGTAMRRSEALTLTWDRVFLDERYVRLDETKNGDARNIPLAPATVGLLRDMPRRTDGRVFSLTPDGASHAFVRAVRRARELYEDSAALGGEPVDDRLLNIRLHDLRREAISRAVESGHFSIIEVAKISGHRSLSVLHNRYAHLHIGALADKLAAAEAARGPIVQPPLRIGDESAASIVGALASRLVVAEERRLLADAT